MTKYVSGISTYYMEIILLLRMFVNSRKNTGKSGNGVISYAGGSLICNLHLLTTFSFYALLYST